jgi:hypothetical protein
VNGRFLMMIGGSGSQNADSASRSSVGRAAGIFVDSSNKQVFVADGYLNSRVVKFDARTGAFLKTWGAYGNPPIDPAVSPPPSNPNGVYAPQPPDPNSRMFNRPVHCVVLAHDGLVYVCDRSTYNLVQVAEIQRDLVAAFTRSTLIAKFTQFYFEQRAIIGRYRLRRLRLYTASRKEDGCGAQHQHGSEHPHHIANKAPCSNSRITLAPGDLKSCSFSGNC